MKKRRIKKSVIKKGIVILSIIVLIVISLKTITVINYHKTAEYKLKKIGYNIETIRKIESLSNENIEYILNNAYIDFLEPIINEKYYIDKNLERYINLKKESDKDLNKIISLVNVNADNEYYTNEKESDLTKKELVLVNKYNYLNETYEPQDINVISARYAYSDNKAPKEAMEYYKKMFNASEKDGVKLIITSAYRSYQEQEETYEYYKKTKGEKYANIHAALKGHSEHQTGLAFDILTNNANMNTFEETKEFTWLQENAYKYGFIMRYPKDKEDITGFEYEPWHYRYVGIEAATTIHNENITFDEYYSYYIEK